MFDVGVCVLGNCLQLVEKYESICERNQICVFDYDMYVSTVMFAFE